MIIKDEIKHSACVAAISEMVDPIFMQSNKCQGYNHENILCHFTGHTKENLYKLISYPIDQKQRRKPSYDNRNPRGSSAHTNSRGHSNKGYGVSGGYVSQTNNNGQNLANNISIYHIDQTQIASTSHDINNAFVAKGHGFSYKEYKLIMDLLNKDTKEMKQANMTCMATCLLSNVFI